MAESKGWLWQYADASRWEVPDATALSCAWRWGAQGAKRVLDLGCGLGRHTLLFSQYGFETYALDLSPDAAEKTRERLKGAGLCAEVRQGDMLALPFEEHFFDCVYSYRVISHQDTAGVAAAIAEIARVLKPGGEVFLTLCSKEHYVFRDPENVRIDENTVLKNEGPEQNVPHFFADKALISKLFGSFEIISIEHVTEIALDENAREKAHYHITARLKRQVKTLHRTRKKGWTRAAFDGRI